MAQQMRNQDFERPSTVISDRRKRKHARAEHAGGFFYDGLTPELRSSLVDYTRRAADGARADGRAALQAQEAEKLARREDHITVLLNKAVEQYAYAKELYKEWAKEGGQRATSAAMVKKALLDDKGRDRPEAQKLEYLRHQVEMRVLGLGWTEYATRWSSNADERVGTVAHLKALLEEIILDEKSRARFTAGSSKGLPTEACPPQQAWSAGLQLGTLDADADAVRAEALFDRQQLEQMADKEMQRRIDAGISDAVETQQPRQAPHANPMHPTLPPALRSPNPTPSHPPHSTPSDPIRSHLIPPTHPTPPHPNIRSHPAPPHPRHQLSTSSWLASGSRCSGSTLRRTRSSHTSSGAAAASYASPTAFLTSAANERRTSCRVARCSGSGTQTRTAARRRVSGG